MELLLQSLSHIITVSEELKNEFLKRGNHCTLKKGTVVHNSGEICSKSYFIKSGVMRLYSYRDGTDISEDFNGPGEWCNANSSFMFQMKDIYNVEALTDCETIYLTYPDYMHILNNHIELNIYIRTLYDYILMRLLDRLTILRFSSAKEKYEIFCKHYSAIQNVIPQYHIASFLGITPETLSRVRKEYVSK